MKKDVITKAQLIVFLALVLIVFARQVFNNQPITLRFRQSVGQKGAGLGEFDFPLGLALCKNYVYVCEIHNNRIQVLERRKNGALSPKFIFGKEGKNPGEFDNPSGLTIKDNYLYVGDGGNSRIQIFRIQDNGMLEYVSQFGKEGSGLGEFSSTSNLCLTIMNDLLFAADKNNGRIQVLGIQPDGSLKIRHSYGEAGEGPGEFNGMLTFNLAAKENYLYVGDDGNYRIQVFLIHDDGTLEFINEIGKRGNGLGEFNRWEYLGLPGTIGMVGYKDYLVVADGGNIRIQFFRIEDNGGLTPVSTYGKKGTGPGEFDGYLAFMAVKDNYLYVSDSGNHRIQVFKITK